MEAWIIALPKIELHHHFEGALRTLTLWSLYQHLQRGGWESLVFESEKHLQRAVQCDETCLTLSNFLSKFDVINGLLQAAHSNLPRQEYYAYLERFGQEVVEDQVGIGGVYLETRLYPFGLISKCTDKSTAIAEARGALDALIQGLQRGVDRFKDSATARGFAAKVILCSLWDHPENTMSLVEMAKSVRDSLSGDLHTVTVAGVDLAGDESATVVPQEHKDAFRLAEQLGLGRTVHVGMEHRSIREAIDDLRATRIGHGYFIAQQPEIESYVRSKQLHIECCITPACLGMRDYHLIKQRALVHFVSAGLSCSLSTDDSTVKAVTLLDEYKLATKLLTGSGRTEADVRRTFVAMQFAALSAAFLREASRALVAQWLLSMPDT